jgi:predicted DNA-binding protein
MKKVMVMGVTLRLSPEAIEKLDAIAAREMRSRSGQCRLYIERCLSEEVPDGWRKTSMSGIKVLGG